MQFPAHLQKLSPAPTRFLLFPLLQVFIIADINMNTTKTKPPEHGWAVTRGEVRKQKDIPLAVQKTFAPVAPLIACLKLQRSEVHVFLMWVMRCLGSCECPEVKEGSRGRVQD